MDIYRKYRTKKGDLLDTFEKIAFFNSLGELKPTQEFLKCWENGGHGSLDSFKLIEKNFNDGTCLHFLHAVSDWSNENVSFKHDVIILSMTREEYELLVIK